VRIAGALAGGVAIAIVVLLLLVEPGHHGFAARPPANAMAVDVGAPSSGLRIRPGFVGLSTEYSPLTSYAGRNPRAINPMFVAFVRNLAPGAAPVIRFGGDTTDWTWWPQAGISKPPWARYVLTPLWFEIAQALALDTHARLILGINFEADSRTLAGGESRALLGGIGRRLIEAFELGNEPEVYGQIGWYARPGGDPVLGRPPSYGFRSYLGDFKRISSVLPRSVPLAGPALALTWPLTVAPRFLSANPRVRLFTLHFYPLKRCFNSTSSPTYPTLAHLLASRSAAPPAGLESAVRAAHSRGIAVRVDEVNSVSCKGLPGLSDSFASALWVLDELFALARAGVDGVNIHTLPHVSYEPFAFSRVAGRWEARVNPLYYGLLLFARSAPAGSELLATSHRPDAALRTWATRGPRGAVRVVLINESADRPLTLIVRPPEPARSARLERLEAPGLTATIGVRLAGQSYGAVTTTGRLVGARRAPTVDPVQGRYVISLPPASAALLIVREPRTS